MKVLILGATGNIGQQTIDVLKKLKYSLVGISFNHNYKLGRQIQTRYRYSPIYPQYSNVKSYDELIKKAKPDIVVNAIVGSAGLEPTIITIKNKKTLCLANKESLVMAGYFVMKLAKQNNVKIYPIDSEHASLFQIINQNKHKKIKKLYITASGGPFYKTPKHKLTNVTFKQATNHPTWKMGSKISIDSATLINKCFEIVEAYWYFNTKKIEALYHPQSLVHAMVEYFHQKIMFVSHPDMKLPIYQALTGFKHKSQYVIPYNHKYTLEKIDQRKWIPIKWAYQILNKPNTTMPIVINVANEYAINLFKDKKITFNEIIPLINQCLKHFTNKKIVNLSQIYLLRDQIIRFLDKKYL